MFLFPLGGLHFGRRVEFWLRSENLDFKADIHQRRLLEIPESFPTICHKRCSPTQTNPFLQKEPLTVLLSDLNEFSLQDFLFRWHYHKKLAYTITCGQWRLTGLSQTVSDPPRTGKYCLDLTLWSFSHLHLAARCSDSAGVPCPVFLGTVGAAMVFVVGCNGCQGGSCSMGAPGKGYREFVSLSWHPGTQDYSQTSPFLSSLFFPLWCYFSTFLSWIYHPLWQPGKDAPQECSGLRGLLFASFGSVHRKVLSSLCYVTQNSAGSQPLYHSVSTAKLLHTEIQATLAILLEQVIILSAWPPTST